MARCLNGKLKYTLWVVCATFCQSAAGSSLIATYDNFVIHDTQLELGQLSTRVWQERVNQAKAQLMPKASISASTSETSRDQAGSEATFKGESYSVTVTQPVFDKRLSLEPQRLDALRHEAISESDELVQSRSMELVESYLSWVNAQLQMRSLRRRLLAVEERLEQVNYLYDVNQSDVIQVVTVENERDRVVAELARSRSRITSAAANLKTFVDPKFLFDELELDLSIDQWPLTEEFLGSIDHNGSESHSILAANARRNSMRVAIDQARGEWFPRIDAALQYKETNVGATDTEVFPTTSVVAQISLTWDFYDSGARNSRISEARINLMEAEIALESLQRMERSERARVLSDMEMQKEAWAAALMEYRSAEKLLTVADRSFELGLGTVGSTLIALERLIEAEGRLASRWLEVILGALRLSELNSVLNRETLELLVDATKL